jgi:hypothetical protein
LFRVARRRGPPIPRTSRWRRDTQAPASQRAVHGRSRVDDPHGGYAATQDSQEPRAVVPAAASRPPTVPDLPEAVRHPAGFPTAPARPASHRPGRCLKDSDGWSAAPEPVAGTRDAAVRKRRAAVRSHRCRCAARPDHPSAAPRTETRPAGLRTGRDRIGRDRKTGSRTATNRYRRQSGPDHARDGQGRRVCARGCVPGRALGMRRCRSVGLRDPAGRCDAAHRRLDRARVRSDRVRPPESSSRTRPRVEPTAHRGVPWGRHGGARSRYVGRTRSEARTVRHSRSERRDEDLRRSDLHRSDLHRWTPRYSTPRYTALHRSDRRRWIPHRSTLRRRAAEPPGSPGSLRSRDFLRNPELLESSGPRSSPGLRDGAGRGVRPRSSWDPSLSRPGYRVIAPAPRTVPARWTRCRAQHGADLRDGPAASARPGCWEQPRRRGYGTRVNLVRAQEADGVSRFSLIFAALPRSSRR